MSGRLADLTVITSDNPRFEEPQAIIDDIKTGIAKRMGSISKFVTEKKRLPMRLTTDSREILSCWAGKGHEDYQEIRGVKHPMDERVLIAQILKERGISF